MNTSKRIIGIITALLLAGAMTACNAEVNVNSESSSSQASTSSQADAADSAVSSESASSEAAASEEASSSAASEAASGESSEKTSSESTESNESEANDDNDDAQNPVMNFVGPYACDRATMEVSALDEDLADITVRWANSAFSHAEWTMSGVFDADTMTVDYSDGQKSVIEVDENGDTVKADVEYSNGTGTITFNEDGTITWSDNEENIADGMVFTFNYAPEE